MKKVSVLVSLVAQMLQFASFKGVSAEKLLELSGVDPKILQHPDNRISIDQYNSIQNHAVQLTGDDTFGIHMGEFAMVNSFSIVGLVMMNCKTIGDAIQKAITYHEIVGNLVQATLKNDKEKIILELSPRMDSYGHTRHCFEASASGFVKLMTQLSGGDFELEQMGFAHKPPEKLQEYRRIFNCEILFDQPKTFLCFYKRYLKLPVIQSNPDLLPLMEKYAQKSLEKVNSKNEYTHKVSELIVSNLNSDPPTLKKVASELAVSVRKLQQKLYDEKTSFSKVLKSMRMSISKKHLKENNHSISEIAFLLGFSEPSAFSKAFVKWTETTPFQYRRRHMKRKMGQEVYALDP